jgi:Family of unknown function (DUF6535)
MAYYLQQNVAILYNISRQISSIAPQFSIPSDPPPTYPSFKPLASNIRVNAFWFMALVFSLSAALLATLVQQWVRDYMHVFQQYSDPLKSARLRQYLHEGWKRWYMPAVAEAVTGLLHVSLFLFFVGLFDFVLNIDTAVKLSTTIPIAITSFLYICTTVARIFKPQSPYQNPVTGLIWYIIQKVSGRRYKDRDSRELKFVSPDMAEGQMQLAMEETEDRKGRDEQSIRWLVSNMTEDAEMESLVTAIPGSFDDKWGLEVWKKVSSSEETKKISRIQHIVGFVLRRTPSDPRAETGALTPGEKTMHELSIRVRHLLDTCKNPGLLASIKLWRKRTRACIEATASLVCCAGAELGQFGDIVKLLGDIGKDQTVRESSSVGKDQSFVIRWTCLSLTAIRPLLESDQSLHEDARLNLERLRRRDNTGEGQAPTRTEKIIETLNKASGCLSTLSNALIYGGAPTEEHVQNILRENESQISILEQIDNDIKNGGFEMDDWSISSVQNSIDQITHQVITRQLPGIKSDFYDTKSANFGQFIELFRDPHASLFMFPSRNLKRIRSFALTLRHHLNLKGHRNDNFQEMVINLRKFESLYTQWDKLLQRHIWRLQDLSDGGGLGFTVELFFLALKQLLSTSLPKESHSALYIRTFGAITSDWRKYEHSPGTQELLLDLVVSDRNSISVVKYPTYIVQEFLGFLDNILQGKIDPPRIEDAETQLNRRIDNYGDDDPRQAHCRKALVVIRKARKSST